MWFWLAIIALLCWSGSDLFSKIGCRDGRDKYNPLKMVIAVGVVMGLHAAYEIFVGGAVVTWHVIWTYLPVSLLYISSMALGYLPCGSTNDFAMSLHLHTMLPAAAEAAATGTPCPLDVGRHNDRYFAYVASFGAFTRSSYSATQAAKNALGHFAYILEGLGDLDSLRPYRCAVDADGERFEGEFIFGAVCNSTSLGGLVKLDPSRVRMDDGKFELLLLRMPKTALDLQNLITAMTRMQYDYPGVILRHVRRVTLTTEENLPWSLDGEYCPSAPRVEIENLPAAIQLVR